MESEYKTLYTDKLLARICGELAGLQKRLLSVVNAICDDLEIRECLHAEDEWCEPFANLSDDFTTMAFRIRYSVNKFEQLKDLLEKKMEIDNI